MKITANEIKPGMIIEHKNDYWNVLKTQHVKPGKGGAFNQVELKSVIKGTKLNERFRSSETIEKAELQEKKFNGPHTNIICTRGANPVAGIGGKANDGMISCDSQSKTPPGFKNTKTHHIEAGHSGVLLNNNVTELLQEIFTGVDDERLV